MDTCLHWRAGLPRSSWKAPRICAAERCLLALSLDHRRCLAYTLLDVRLSSWRLALRLPWSVAGLRFMLTRAVPPLFKIVAPSCTAFSFGAWSPFDLARCGLSWRELFRPSRAELPRRAAPRRRTFVTDYTRRALRPIVEEARSLSHLRVGLVLEFILESLEAPTDRSLQ